MEETMKTKTQTLPAMPREAIVETFAAFFETLYESGVSYRKVREGAAALNREFAKQLPQSESAPVVGANIRATNWLCAIDSAILRAETRKV